MLARATNIISWEYWNDTEKKLTDKKEENEELDFFEQEKENSVENILSSKIYNDGDDILITPFFPVYKNSTFKPSDRWECWIGHTNFKIDQDFLSFLNKKVDGISCLNVLDPYCFSIGIGRLFTFDKVRAQIELKIKGTDDISGSNQG